MIIRLLPASQEVTESSRILTSAALHLKPSGVLSSASGTFQKVPEQMQICYIVPWNAPETVLKDIKLHQWLYRYQEKTRKLANKLKK